MDPAEQQSALAAQGGLLDRHKQAIQILLDNMAELSREVSHIVGSRSSPLPVAGAAAAGASPPPSNHHVCDLEPFAGDLDQPSKFSSCSAEPKINYIIGLLRWRALSWA